MHVFYSFCFFKTFFNLLEGCIEFPGAQGRLFRPTFQRRPVSFQRLLVLLVEFSLEFQEARCRQYAEQHDLEVVMVLAEAKSGYIHYSLREKLTLARELVRDKVADVVVIWNIRRLARNFVHSTMICHEIEEAGAEVISVSEPFLNNTLTGKLMRALLAWQAESEREEILEHANRHWQDRLEKGLPVSTGYKRYGWDWMDKAKTAYMLNEEEAMVRFAIFHMFVELDMSLRTIVHKLTEDEILAPGIKRNPKAKRGRHWTHTTVYDFLRDPAAKGDLVVCSRKNVLDERGKLKRLPHPQKKVIPGGIPRIVSDQMYERAQTKLASNQVEKSHEPKEPTLFLLRGHVRCGTCGRRMCTRIMKGVPYYYCGNRRSKYTKCPDIPVVRADLIDPLAWAACCRMFERIEALHAELEAAIGRAVSALLEDTTGQEQMDELQTLIDYAQSQRPQYEPDSYMYNLITQDILTKEAQLARFKEECAASSPIAAATAMYQARLMEFMEFLNVMRGTYDQATFQEKRNALDVLGVCVTMQAIPKEARRNGRVPTIDELKGRMAVTYSPMFRGTGVRPSPEDLRQDLRVVTQKIRPDWDITQSELIENWEGDKSLHYPYKHR